MARFSGLLTFDRSDRLGFAALLVLVVGVQTVVRVVLPVVAWVRGDPVPVPMIGEVAVPALDGRAVEHGVGRFDVLVEGASPVQRLADLVPGVLTVLIVAGVTALVLAVMHSVATGDPFGPPTVRRLRALAGLLVVGTPVVTFAALSVDGWLLSSVDLGGLDPAMAVDPPWEAVVGGLFVALLAEAFVVGRRLREDVEGLV